MRKIIILTAFLLLSAFPAIVLSMINEPAGTIDEGTEGTDTGGGTTTGEGISTVEGLFEVMTKITNYLFTALIIFAVIFIIVAAFNFLTAGGDPTKLSKAKNQLLWALVAVAIGALSWGLVEMVKRIMGVVSS